MASKFRDEAIPLITFTDDKFKVNPEALEFLKEVEAPMAVIGVAGAYRSGKSYLLNKIVLNQSRGFEIGSTINACTKGIWVWGRPVKAQTEDGSIVNMVVMDSEGLGSLEADASHDSRIFALILLLSSTFVYNSTGAIDENSLSQLSVVINITKHIAVRATLSKRESGQTSLTDVDQPPTDAPPVPEDPEEYSRHFPDFLWVLRDFALQMVDEYGDDLTPSQYLENALQFGQADSGQDASKDRIRELIRAFFRNRQCFALVRPVINEQDLGRLDTLKLENLRAEFVEGALRLKNALYQGARVKRVNERDVSGEVLGSMLASYVQTMNEGVVPNIENTWSYVTRKQAGDLVAAAVSEYLRAGSASARQLIPTSKGELAECLANARSAALGHFRRASLLGPAEQKDYLRLIATRIDQEERQLLQENDAAFERLLESSMLSSYRETVYAPVLSDSVRTAGEVVSLFTALRDDFEAAEPHGPRKHFRVSRFVFGKLCECFAVFARNADQRFADELAEQSREFADRTQQLAEEARTLGRLRAEQQARAEEMAGKLAQAALENSKLEETVRFLQEESSRVEAEADQGRAEERAGHRRRHEELASRLEEARAQLRALEASRSQQQSDFDLQLSLLGQRVEFHQNNERQLAEQKQRLLDRQRELEEAFEERGRRLREDFEEKLAEKAGELSAFREQKSTLEEELSELRELSCSFQKEATVKETDWQQLVEGHAATARQCQARLAALESQANVLSDEKTALADRVAQLTAERLAQDLAVAASADRVKAVRAELETQLELAQQHSDFLRVRVDELETEAAEAKRQRELSAQNTHKTTSFFKNDVSAQLQEVKSGFEQRLAKLARDHEAEREELLASANGQAEELEARVAALKEEKDRLQHAKLELAQAAESWQGKARLAEERLAAFEKGQAEAVRAQVSSLELRLRQAVEGRDALLAEKEEEALAAKTMLETHLANMRVVYESEKATLERRLAEERLQRDGLIRESLEEVLARKDSEVQQLDEELEMLKSELLGQEVKHKAVLGKLASENAELKGRAEACERRALESANSLQKRHAEETGRLRSQLAAVESEKRLVEERWASLKAEVSARTMEAFKLEQAVSAHQAVVAKLNADRDRLAEDLQHELAELRAKLEKCEAEKFQLSEELLGSRVGHTKDLALKNQKIEFIEGKIGELSALNETTQRDCDDRVRAVTARLGAELEELRAKTAAETDQLTAKYEEKKRQLKDSEAAVGARLAELEKTRIVLTERNAFLEDKRTEAEESFRKELARLEREARSSVESSGADRSQLAAEVEALRRERHDLEGRVGELSARLDKDRAIHEAKVSFLEQQARKLRGDLAESQSNFDAVFQNFQQFRASDKEETEHSHANYVLSLEERYSAQVQDLKDQNRALSDSSKLKLKALEKEVRRLEAANEEALTQRFEANMQHEKRVNELLLNERCMAGEVERLREGVAKAVLEGQRDAEGRTDALLKRVADLEAKLKALENEKSLLAFKQEKTKTNWNIEKDALLSGKTDLLEKIDRAKKQNECLSRENDKLKADLKMVKKNNIMNSIMNLNPTKMGRVSSGLNDNPLRDITDSASNFDEPGRF